MNNKNDATNSGISLGNLVSVPAVFATLVLLFLGAGFVADGTIENDGYLNILILPSIAALAAIIGRISAVAPLGQFSNHRTALLSAGFALTSLALVQIGFCSVLCGFTFSLVGIMTLILTQAGRNEESSILLSIVVGFHLAVAFAARHVLDESTWVGNNPDLIDASRAATGSMFFAFWAASIALGLLVTLAARGRFETPGVGPWFQDIPTKFGKEGLSFIAAVFAANLIPLLWLASIGDIQTYENHHYLGSVWGLATTVIILFLAFCRAERWNVLGTVVAVNWLLYTVAHLQEIGNEFPSMLAGNGMTTSFAWFFLAFWLNVGGMMVASRGYFGDIAPMREHSDLRRWWQTHSFTILIGAALFVGLAVRTGWNVLPAMNAAGTNLWDMTGGSDPWYMKRVVDYIIAERSHFIFDADRAYPMGAINPRPPLFSWSLALGGLGLAQIGDIATSEAVWWSVAALPAVFGALIVLPVAGIASSVHSRGAGIVAAWLMALMPGHISHSTFGLADHDAFALLFLAMAFYFWVKAVDGIENERMFVNPSANPLYLIAGIREMWVRNSSVMANATLSGISFATVALGWKGFVYGPGILFLAFAGQIFLNMLRRRDSLQLTSAALQMMLVTFLIPLPFYTWPGLNLLFDPSGFQPMFYIIGFTFALGWVTCSFRDKPWLLVLGSGVLLLGGILLLLYVLQYLEYYNGWDILFTGGFYFSKNKIFGTIGEAQAPSRGVLFASYGPVVALIAVTVACIMIWRGMRREKQSHMLLGLWVLIAIYMAWSAGRFIFNATPAMAVVGGIGIASMWQRANFSNFVKEWRRAGIGTPRMRFRSVGTASRSNPAIPAALLVILLVSSQHMTYGIDSGIPRGESAATDVDQTIYDFTPDILREEFLGLSVLKGENYDSSGGNLWYMGTFGPGFNSGSWNMAYEWLAEQDTDVSFSERPAFVSWWDYGFQALAQGQHPTVADNFQSGIPNSGAMLLSGGQEHTLSLFIATLAQGDRRYNDGNGFTTEFNEALSRHMSEAQLAEFSLIMGTGPGDSEVVSDRAMALMASDGDVELYFGGILAEDGTLESTGQWVVKIDGEQVGNATDDETAAKSAFNEARSSVGDFDMKVEYYDIGGYLYTPDLIEDYDDVSTNLHRMNSRLAMSRAFLIQAFDLIELNSIYDDVTTSVEYDVQDYEGNLGETVTRNNEIRYFAVDNRLYPLGGKLYEDGNYHRGQTTGIFHAPTTLSGLDTDTYISSMYLTQRGDGQIIPRTAEEFNQEYLNDIIRQNSGASSDPSEVIRMVDIDYQHQTEFFETMVAKIYVGYGTSTLGLPGDAEQPKPHFYMTGAPGSYLENAYPLPGAMMNHFVISNWYDGSERCAEDENGTQIDDECRNPTIGDANTQVKIVKYYSGATLEGTVTLDGFGAVPNARLLIERDAFSGDEVEIDGEVVDRDERTYWIPIGTVDADENGDYSFQVPAGKIRVSAFFGEPDLGTARTQIMTSNVQATFGDLFEETTSATRTVNPITGILGNVSGATWLAETIVNVSGEAGHSNGEVHVSAPIVVEPASSTGRLVWTGSEPFDGEAVTGALVELSPSWDEIDLEPYTLTTSVGEVSGEDLSFSGDGVVTFTGEGSVISETPITATDFTGNYTQVIYHNHSLTGEGEFSGRGTLDGEILDDIDVTSCGENDTMPEDSTVCMMGSGDYLLFGTVNATGRFTANGSVSYTQMYEHATLVGNGVFTVNTSADLESYGTLSGKGTFAGEGIFGGEMVEPGTFHIVDAIPGDYDVTVIFADGTRVEINDGFTIAPASVGQISKIDIVGGELNGKLIDSTGNALNASIVLLSEGDEVSEAMYDCSESPAPCLITPDEDGSFSAGPITPGKYTAQVDIDGDGFNELSAEYVFDANESSVFEFPTPVPSTSDLTFQLFEDVDGVDTIVPELNVSLHLKNGTGEPVEAVWDADSQNYHVELVEGVWILNHTLSDAQQVWEQIEIGDEDIFADYNFHTSQLVSGTVYYSENSSSDTPINEEKILDHVEVDFHWNGFSTTVSTDSQGHFSLVLPQGAIVDASVQLGVELKLVDGIRFTVEEGMDNLSILAQPGHGVNGAVQVNRLGNNYHREIGGWEPVSVVATNVDYEVQLRASVDDSGLFEMVLPAGEWEFTVDADWLNPGVNLTNVDGINKTIDILVYPSNSIVEVDFFLDHSGDNNVSNGTPVSYDFSIVSLLNNGIDYTITENGTEWNDVGQASVPVEPGSYRIAVDISDPSAGDVFGTRIMTGVVNFDVGLNGEVIQRSIGFDPEYRFSMTLTNESGGILSEQLVRLKNVETNWILSRITDDNGSIVDHIGEGTWIVTSTVDDTIPEGLRQSVTISEATANDDLQMSTSELAEVTFILYEDESEAPLSDLRLTIESTEGLGEQILDMTDDSGAVTMNLIPGTWTASLNHVEDKKQWIVEDTNVTFTVGASNEFNLTAALMVELGGSVFWDLNDNDESNALEGIENVSLTLTADDLTHTLTTDEHGDWAMFVPADTAWVVNTSFLGFDDVSQAISVSNVSNSVDIELTAGNVEVSGSIEYIDAEHIEALSDSIVLELIPTEGLVRDSVTPEKILEDGVWTGGWSADVEPGDWILRASVIEENLVAMDLLKADVTDGGSLNLTLSTGGVLLVETHWLDYNGTELTLADVDDYNFVFDLGSGLDWVGGVDENGSTSILLPVGRVDMSSEFEVEQRDRVMEFIAGKGVEIRAGQETPVQILSHSRTTVHTIEVSTLNLTSGDDSYVGALDDVTLVTDDENGFVPVEFVLSVDYQGHESFDSFTAIGSVAGSDGADWLVEFHNGSGEWNSTTSFDVGLDNALNFNDLHIRVTAAEQNESHSFTAGHEVTIRLSTKDGYQKIHDLTVRVPQIHGFELTEPMDDVYGVALGESSSIGIKFTNTGNGDEVFNFEFDYSEAPINWEVTGASSHSLGGFVSTTHTIQVISPANASGDEEFTIYVSVTDKVGGTYDTIEVNVKSSEPSLRITDYTASGGDVHSVEAGSKVNYLVTVENSGLVDANLVQLNATLCKDIYCNNVVEGVNATAIHDIPAGETVTFSLVIDLADVSIGPYYIDFDINKTGFNSVEEFNAKNVDVRSPAIDGTTDWIGWLLGALLVVVVLLLTRTGSRRPGAPF